jgi:diguanylate cyclase (GGDEF)-like protein/PAS domain S-box-containing protein
VPASATRVWLWPTRVSTDDVARSPTLIRPVSFVKRHAAGVMTLFGTVSVAAYLLCPSEPAVEAIVYMVAAFGGLTALLVGVRWRLRRPGIPWQAFTIAVALFSAGDLLWALDAATGVHSPWRHLSDVLYLASYPLFACALVGFSASRREPVETLLRQLADAALLFAAAFTAFWFLLLDPMIEGSHLAPADLALTLAYPTFDLVLLALAFRLAFTSGSWPTSYRLLTAAFFAMFIGDITWRTGIADGSYDVSSWINTMFMSGYVLWGAAALHPSLATISRFGFEAATARHGAAWRRLAAFGIASCVPPIVLIVSRHRIDDPTDLIVFAVVLALLPILSLVRIADMLRSLHRVVADRDQIIGASPVPIAVIDRHGIVHVWNPAAEEISGYAAADVLGSPAPIVPAEDPARVRLLYEEALRGVSHDGVDVKVLTRSGDPVDVRVSNASLHTNDGRIVVLFEDVTRRRTQEAEISFLANHDPLTNLPNRRRFEEELADASANTTAAAAHAHLVLFDIDDFKSLNDTGGHAVGDEVLRNLASLLRNSVREGSLARLSGDEFALILIESTSEEATVVVERLLQLTRDFRLDADGLVFDVSLSAGIYSMLPGDAPELALRRADEALYRAKGDGKNRAVLWTRDSVATIGAGRSWSPRIKDALRDDRLDLYLQPIVTLADEVPSFHEALCRLRAEDGSTIPAAEWIEHAERTGLMPAIDLRMIEKAEQLLCSALDMRVFVNISPSSFLDSTVLRRLEAALERVPRGSFGIEVTEHTALADLDRAAETLARFRAQGALVAIDDFGLGFTSFAELATLPCDIVKIPGTFSGAEDRSDTAVIAGAITKIAHHYGKKVVIEGVENVATARRAKLIGIEYGQGWHYGRPQAPAQASLAGAAASS